MSFETFVVGVGIALLCLMLAALYRIIAGPTTLDRIVAVNMIGTKTAVMLIIIGSAFGKVGMFVDFALAYALLNFTGSITAARYIHRAKMRGGDAPSGEEAPLR